MTEQREQSIKKALEYCIEFFDKKEAVQRILTFIKDEEAITVTQCCKTLNLEVKPTFEKWLNTNFNKYDNEYYQDKNRNGIWKKHQLYKLYKETTKF